MAATRQCDQAARANRPGVGIREISFYRLVNESGREPRLVLLPDGM